jgi:23S rRNA (guanosine2251-2'-O)-methyltransferase
MNIAFEIRMCGSCGLRYPLTQGQSFGVRCPHCLGETRVVIKRDPKIENEAVPKVSGQASNEKPYLTVLLDNIRSAWNTGSILRSADGFGFRHAYLCGITPTPEVEAVTKTSLGAEETVTWSHHKDAVRLVKGLKKEGVQIWALE